MWVNAGRKRDDWLFETMKLKKHEYHLALKRCIENNNKLKARIAIDRAKKNDTCLIRELKKLNGCASNQLPEVVDGCTGEDAIVNKFKEVYQTIYNKNETDVEMALFSEKLSRLTSQNDIEMVYLINENVVGNAIRLMKQNKSDVSNGFVSNALKQGPVILHKK